MTKWGNETSSKWGLGHYVGRIVGESIEVVLNLLEEEAIEYKVVKRREKKWND